MVLYTVCVSLPILLVLVCLCEKVRSGSFYVKVNWVIECEVGVVVVVILLGAFLVKSPVFLVHLWLPKAHVEAPVSGSMLLAGVLLKFGGYGVIMVFYWFSLRCGEFCYFLVRFVLWGGLLCGFICLRQIDMKSLIAYSSVGHMALCLGGIISCFGFGWWGGVFIMVAHGLCSPGLFGLAGFVFKLFGSRVLVFCSGVMSILPTIRLCWFLFCSRNMSFPPRLRLLSEIYLILSISCCSRWLMIPTGLMVFVVGAYSLILYSLVQHGVENRIRVAGKVLGCEFILIRFLLWVPLNLLVLSGDVLVSYI